MRGIRRRFSVPAVTALALLAALALGSQALAQTRAPLYCWQSHPRYVGCVIMDVGTAQTRVSCTQYGGPGPSRGWVCAPGLSSGLSAPDGATCWAAGATTGLPFGLSDEDVCAALCGACKASNWQKDPPPDNPNAY